MIKNKDLKKRIIDISYKHKLSHLGSCLTAVDIIAEVFEDKKPTDKFVLSQGHAGLALYVVLEKYKFGDAEEMVVKSGIHPDRLLNPSVDCSTGSLGHGLPIAIGMAVANRNKNVYCLISDGELAEGSMYESLRFIKKHYVDNLHVYLNHNGYSAYDETEPADSVMFKDYVDIRFTNVDNFPKYLQGVEGHYHVLSEEEYLEICKYLNDQK